MADKLTNRVALVVDASGSMGNLRRQAVEGVKIQIEAFRDDGRDQRNLLTLVTFGTVVNTPIIVSSDVNTLSTDLMADYRPAGRTALLDAIGESITLLQAGASGGNVDESFVVHIISDGMENNSAHWTWAALRERITALQATERWTFTFLGANQNVREVGQKLGIPEGNLEAFQATPLDTDRAMRKMHTASLRHLRARREGIFHSASLMEDGGEEDGFTVDKAIPQPRALIRAVEDCNTNPGSSCHGPDHWKCVAMSGLRLLKETPAADPTVVLLFALFHDSQREDDGRDPYHGLRAAVLAQRMGADMMRLTGKQMDQLVAACEGHTGGTHPKDATVAVCWDSDRLNLWRVGITPNPRRMFTEAARNPELIEESKAHVRRAFSWRDIFAEYRALPRP